MKQIRCEKCGTRIQCVKESDRQQVLAIHALLVCARLQKGTK